RTRQQQVRHVGAGDEQDKDNSSDQYQKYQSQIADVTLSEPNHRNLSVRPFGRDIHWLEPGAGPGETPRNRNNHWSRLVVASGLMLSLSDDRQIRPGGFHCQAPFEPRDEPHYSESPSAFLKLFSDI